MEELAVRLDNALPPDIHVSKIAIPVLTPQEIAWADYKIIFNNPDKNLISRAESIFEGDEITVMKKVKQGREKVEKQVDVKGKILRYSLESENVKVVLNITLSSGMRNNINPSLLIGKIIEGSETDADAVDILKLKSYTSDLKEWE